MFFKDIKRSQKSLKIAVLICALSLSTVAQARPNPRQNQKNQTATIRVGGDGGGGGALVCYNPDMTIKDAELLDLWEAQILDNDWADSLKPHKLTIKYTNEVSVNKQIDKALKKLRAIDNMLYDRVASDLKYVMNPTHLDTINLSKIFIQPPKDANDIYGKSNGDVECPLKGMMYFNNKTKKLGVNPVIYSKLINNTNVAAAMTHEAIYKTLRETSGHKDSLLTRKLNGCLYAEEDCLGAKDTALDLPQDRPVYICNSPSSDFYLYASDLFQLDVGNWSYVTWTAVFTRLGSFHSKYPLISTQRLHVEENYTDKSQLTMTDDYSTWAEHEILADYKIKVLKHRDSIYVSGNGSKTQLKTNIFLPDEVTLAENVFVFTGEKIPKESATCRVYSSPK